MRENKNLVALGFLEETEAKIRHLTALSELSGAITSKQLQIMLKEILEDVQKIHKVLEKVDLFQILLEQEQKIKFMEEKIENIQNHINHNSISNK